MSLYIVPGASILFYQQGNHNSCILSSLASALYYMGDGYVSEYIIRRKQKSLLEIQNKIWMQLFCGILMGYYKEKNKTDSIVVLRNGIHPRHMIYFGISLLIQIFVCYYTCGTRQIIVLQFSVNGHLIPIL